MAPERYAVLLVTALLMSACTPAAIGRHTCSGQQIVITFAPGVDVMSPGFTAGLSADADVSIVYMRHMFAEHHLYCACQGERTCNLDDALLRLQKRSDIQTVEIDRLKHPGTAQ